MYFQVVEKNKLILARRMYDSEKAWIKGTKHFIMLLASQVQPLEDVLSINGGNDVTYDESNIIKVHE